MPVDCSAVSQFATLVGDRRTAQAVGGIRWKEMNTKRVKMLIGVLSCHKYRARREACLETWANVKHRHDVDLVFVLGDGQSPWPVRDGCLLHCPCPDDYDSLSMKTRWLCLWAIANYRFDFLFKCDDDTYVNVDRLLNAIHKGNTSAVRYSRPRSIPMRAVALGIG